MSSVVSQFFFSPSHSIHPYKTSHSFSSVRLLSFSPTLHNTSGKGKFNSLSGTPCSECKAGFFQDQNTNPSVACKQCPAGWGAILDENKQQVKGSAVCLDLNWKKPEDCTNDQYLDNQLLSNPSNWSCATCPQGGACSGPVTWSTLGPLFGWWKLPNSVTFTKCLYPPACLGAANSAFENQYQSEDLTDLAMVGVITGVNATNTTCAIHLGFRNESRLCHTCSSTSRRKE